MESDKDIDVTQNEEEDNWLDTSDGERGFVQTPVLVFGTKTDPSPKPDNLIQDSSILGSTLITQPSDIEHTASISKTDISHISDKITELSQPKEFTTSDNTNEDISYQDGENEEVYDYEYEEEDVMNDQALPPSNPAVIGENIDIKPEDIEESYEEEEYEEEYEAEVDKFDPKRFLTSFSFPKALPLPPLIKLTEKLNSISNSCESDLSKSISDAAMEKAVNKEKDYAVLVEEMLEKGYPEGFVSVMRQEMKRLQYTAKKQETMSQIFSTEATAAPSTALTRAHVDVMFRLITLSSDSMKSHLRSPSGVQKHAKSIEAALTHLIDIFERNLVPNMFSLLSQYEIMGRICAQKMNEYEKEAKQAKDERDKATRDYDALKTHTSLLEELVASYGPHKFVKKLSYGFTEETSGQQPSKYLQQMALATADAKAEEIHSIRTAMTTMAKSTKKARRKSFEQPTLASSLHINPNVPRLASPGSVHSIYVKKVSKRPHSSMSKVTGMPTTSDQAHTDEYEDMPDGSRREKSNTPGPFSRSGYTAVMSMSDLDGTKPRHQTRAQQQSTAGPKKKGQDTISKRRKSRNMKEKAIVREVQRRFSGVRSTPFPFSERPVIPGDKSTDQRSISIGTSFKITGHGPAPTFPTHTPTLPSLCASIKNIMNGLSVILFPSSPSFSSPSKLGGVSKAPSSSSASPRVIGVVEYLYRQNSHKYGFGKLVREQVTNTIGYCRSYSDVNAICSCFYHCACGRASISIWKDILRVRKKCIDAIAAAQCSYDRMLGFSESVHSVKKMQEHNDVLIQTIVVAAARVLFPDDYTINGDQPAIPQTAVN
ncbi:hypothetical protein ADUPG1_010837, partial [Aduncisulcus paluster]